VQIGEEQREEKEWTRSRGREGKGEEERERVRSSEMTGNRGKRENKEKWE
jgi:hypothetical protein